MRGAGFQKKRAATGAVKVQIAAIRPRRARFLVAARGMVKSLFRFISV